MIRQNLVGRKFGRLTVQEFAGRSKGSDFYWDCTCDRGNTKRTLGMHLKNGATKSCGCFQKEQARRANITHGHSRKGLIIKEYHCWEHMTQRCNNPSNPSYPDYGGRGIKVCDRWLYSFANFLEDMGPRPLGMTLDRKDNDGDYCKENCRWATSREQNNNRRDNVWIEYNGETRTISQWARHLGIHANTLWNRLNKVDGSNRNIEDALFRPIRSRGSTL